MNQRFTIYIQFCGGRWEAYFHGEYGSTHYFHSHNKDAAIDKARRASGYDRIRIVNVR